MMSLSRRAFLTVSAASALPAPEAPVYTVTGPVSADALGVTLMHEHAVTDLRAPVDRTDGDYNRADAIETALPHFAELRAAGCKTLVEVTPIYIGRDVEALRDICEKSGVQIVAATGIYAAAEHKFIPPYAYQESAGQLAERYVREFEEGIGQTGIKPGIIKTGVNSKTPLPAIERKLVRAAALAHQQTGLTVAAHTGPAAPALEELEIIESLGMDPGRFIWVHAQSEKDHAARIGIARRGAWVELDGISPKSAAWHLECVLELAQAGFAARTLISQDAGWYRPGPEGGSGYRGYTFLFETFVPMLREAGFTQSDLDQLLIHNPRQALAGSRH